MGRYETFVAEGIDIESIWAGLKGQIFLGDEGFVSRMQALDKGLSHRVWGGGTKIQARPLAPSLEALASKSKSRNETIIMAYATGSYSYQQIADFYGLHFTTVGKIVRKARSRGSA